MASRQPSPTPSTSSDMSTESETYSDDESRNRRNKKKENKQEEEDEHYTAGAIPMGDKTPGQMQLISFDYIFEIISERSKATHEAVC